MTRQAKWMHLAEEGATSWPETNADKPGGRWAMLHSTFHLEFSEPQHLPTLWNTQHSRSSSNHFGSRNGGRAAVLHRLLQLKI